MPAESFYTAPKALEHVTSRMFEIDFPELRWRDFLPLNTEADEGDEFYAYEEEELIGSAKPAHTYGRSAPKVDVKVTKTSAPIHPVLTSFEYSVQDVRNASQSGRSLPERKARAAREFVERQLDEIMLVGDADLGMTGLFNNSAVPNSAASGTFATRTPDQLIGEFNTVLGTMVDSTNGREGSMVDIILPHLQYMDLSTRRVSDTGMTVLAYIRQNIPEIRSIRKSHRLNGLSGSDRMVAYLQDSSKVEAILPLDVMAHPPQLQLFVWETGVEARTAGTVFYKPYSAYYLTGI